MSIAQQIEEKNTASPILTKTTRTTRGSDYQKYIELENTNRHWTDADMRNRNRLFENLRAFFDIDGGAWDREALNELRRQGRHPVSFNIAEQKLRTLAGSIQSEKFDYEFMATNLREYPILQAIKHWYYSDKEQYNYTYSENKTLLRGLIQVGDEEMEVKYDIRPTGAIAFSPRLPGTIIQDPFWLSDNIKDWKRAIKHSWMTARQILDHYEINDPQLELIAKQDEQSGERYERRENVDDYEQMPVYYGSQLLVVEYRWLEQIKTTRLYGRLPNKKTFPFPLEAKEAEVKKIMKQTGIVAEDIKELPYEDEILKYTAIAPHGTTRTLIDGNGVNHPVQCGFIGFFRFSAAREMGLNKGVMESILDIQRTLNYREMKKDDIIAAAGVGAIAVNKEALENGKRDLDEIKQNKTRPDYVLGVNGDPNKIFGTFPMGKVPDSIWQDISGLIDMFDRVSPVTPALEGSASQDESGVLFEMRHAVTKLGTLILYDNWQNHLMNKAEAWYNQSQITYKGIYTEVPLYDQPGTIEFNSPEYVDGQKVYVNSVEDLPRGRVIVSLSNNSPTEQMSKRAMLFDMSKMLSANPEMAKQQFRVVMNKMIDTLELTPQERSQYRMLATIQEQIDVIELYTQREALIANMLSSKVGQAQAAAMLESLQGQMNQAMQPQGAPPPQIGEPQPVPIEQEQSTAPGAPVDTYHGEFQP